MNPRVESQDKQSIMTRRLANLSNFTSDEWVKYNRYTRIGYDEESEFYELEMDAEGDLVDILMTTYNVLFLIN